MNSAIDYSRRFYEGYVAPMIKRDFAQYESRIAIGIVGEGSDCFGYDDFVSRDHDFGSGVVMWLTDSDYDEFGQELSDAYDEIIDSHPGNNLTDRLTQRRGVMTNRMFYNNILGANCYNEECVLSDDMWLGLDHNCIATAVNGEVFRDDLGKFSAYRRFLLNYYPDRVWKIRIVDELHLFAQALQVNYSRCMTRGDHVAATMCRMQGISSAMQLFFLMKREYPPYYKWTYRRLTELDTDGRFAKWIEQLSMAGLDDSKWEMGYDYNFINVADEVVRLTERIAGLIVLMLQEHGLTDKNNNYLEVYVEDISSELTSDL